MSIPTQHMTRAEQAAYQAPPGIRVVSDPATGCQYLVSPGLFSGVMQPRRNSSGAHVGCRP